MKLETIPSLIVLSGIGLICSLILMVMMFLNQEWVIGLYVFTICVLLVAVIMLLDEIYTIRSEQKHTEEAINNMFNRISKVIDESQTFK